MDFLPENIDEYAASHTQSESDLLAKLNRDTYTKVLAPRMLSGHMQGRILSMFSKMIQPKLILEIGTYTGYSALCMAEGLANGGVLHTLEVDPEIASFAKRYINKSEYADNIEMHCGNATELISELNLTDIDLVFIDADKSNYINYYNQILSSVRKGGYIIFDNVLWSGKVTEPAKEKDLDTKTLQELNKLIQDDERVENILLPVRDGLMIARVI